VQDAQWKIVLKIARRKRESEWKIRKESLAYQATILNDILFVSLIYFLRIVSTILNNYFLIKYPFQEIMPIIIIFYSQFLEGQIF